MSALTTAHPHYVRRSLTYSPLGNSARPKTSCPVWYRDRRSCRVSSDGKSTRTRRELASTVLRGVPTGPELPAVVMQESSGSTIPAHCHSPACLSGTPNASWPLPGVRTGPNWLRLPVMERHGYGMRAVSARGFSMGMTRQSTQARESLVSLGIPMESCWPQVATTRKSEFGVRTEHK